MRLRKLNKNDCYFIYSILIWGGDVMKQFSLKCQKVIQNCFGVALRHSHWLNTHYSTNSIQNENQTQVFSRGFLLSLCICCDCMTFGLRTLKIFSYVSVCELFDWPILNQFQKTKSNGDKNFAFAVGYMFSGPCYWLHVFTCLSSISYIIMCIIIM